MTKGQEHQDKINYKILILAHYIITHCFFRFCSRSVRLQLNEMHKTRWNVQSGQASGGQRFHRGWVIEGKSTGKAPFQCKWKRLQQQREGSL